jgi:hypothetical protein
MKKFIILFTVFLLSFSLFSSHVMAYSYNEQGGEPPSYLNTLYIDSPLHVGYNNEKVTGVYNEPRSGYFHRGVDYSTYDSSENNYNRPVYPVASGTVYGYNSGSGNRYIILRHSTGGQYWYSIYMHLNSISVTSGSVSVNTQIGVSGSTGTSAPHLHWEVNKSSSTFLSSSRISLDPFPYLNNTYGGGGFANGDWTSDHTLIKMAEYSASLGMFRAIVYGIYSQTRVGPTENPKVYWRYSGTSTWNVGTMTKYNGYIYEFNHNFDTSKNYIDFFIYTKGKWFNNSNIYDTHSHSVYSDPAPSPSSWTSTVKGFYRYTY